MNLIQKIFGKKMKVIVSTLKGTETTVEKVPRKMDFHKYASQLLDREEAKMNANPEINRVSVFYADKESTSIYTITRI